MIETAERRMFAKTIIDSDAFLDMPLSAQALYFQLSMRADDDGFVNSPKRIQRMIGASEDDLKLLIAKSFVLVFDTGVIVIKHWRINNWIRADRKISTTYTDELDMLHIKENGAYSLETLENTEVQPSDNQVTTKCQPSDNQMSPQYRLDKYRLDKDSKGESKRFTPPSLDEVSAYINEKGYNIDPEAFIDFYASKGWMVGKNKMKDWKAAVGTWARRDRDDKPKPQPKPPQTGGKQANNPFHNYDQHQYSDDEFAEMERAMMAR